MAKEKRNILAFDAALAGCHVAFVGADGQRFSRQIETQRDQARLLVPIIQDILNEAKKTFQDMDVIVSTNGPGSFTGLRLGLATARALGLALQKPVHGVNSFELMQAHYRKKGVEGALLIVLETKRRDFYAQYFDEEGEPASDMMALSAREILNKALQLDQDIKIGGDCLARFRDDVGQDGRLLFLDNVTQPDPLLLCDIVSKRLGSIENRRVEPIYLRGADVSQPKNKPRVLKA